MDRTTYDFVDVYRESKKIRLDKLSENIGLKLPYNKKNHQNKF